MKIGFLGNTNNYPFMLARAFRRLGHDVVFIVTRLEALHRPEFRYADIGYPYPDWVREIVFSTEAAYVTRSPARVEAVKTLRDCDFVVLNDLGVSLAQSIDRPYLAMLTGSDLSFYCDPASEPRVLASMTTRNPLKRLFGKWLWRQILNRQRAAVRRAPLIFHFDRGLVPESDRLLDGLGVSDGQRLFFLMAEIVELQLAPFPQNDQLRLFCATRFTWKTPMLPGDSPLDFKGTDVMVRGMGLFWRKHRIETDINLVRKGRHVAETVSLVDAEGLSGQVTWHAEMSQAEVWRQYALADLVFDQFGEGLVAMAGLEAMAAGRPVIANGRPEIMEPLLGEPSPICQAKTPEEVCRELERLVGDSALRQELGLKSREWVKRHFNPERAAIQVLERLQSYL